MPSQLCASESTPFTCETPSTDVRLVECGEIRLSEIMAALSLALDITQGQPPGHCMRTAMIGMRLANDLQLSTDDRSALFYALLLKDLGCSSNAAKMSYLFGADDHEVKRESKDIDWTKAGQAMRYAWKQCAPGGSVIEKLLRMAALARSGEKGAKKIVEVRCERGADIARMLQFPAATADAIRALDEHWNGRGHPYGLKGEQIPLLGRICCLAQTVEVFFTAHGLPSMIDMVRDRRGQWFDPQLCDALIAMQSDTEFWSRLQNCNLLGELGRWEPQDAVLMADEACLDRVAEAFARVVDAKSPWTFQHSVRVSEIAVGISREFGYSDDLQRDIRRAGLLHDIGKLGVSNLILDKAEKLTDNEFAEIRKHPDYSQQILGKVPAFQTLADVASAHHERLDGHGYHRQLEGAKVHWVSRILAVADICEALSAKRPYRDPLPWEKIQQILGRDAGPGVDPECLAALEHWHEFHALESRVELQLQEVDRLIAELI